MRILSARSLRAGTFRYSDVGCSVILVLGRPGAVAISISDYCAELERRHSDHHHALAGVVMVIDA